jgi:hypothetical protein
VVNEAIYEEWNNHRSAYANTWLMEMFGRKKVDSIEQDLSNNLEDRVREIVTDVYEFETIRKDIHLIQSALAADKVVISLDDNARRAFAGLTNDIRILKEIVWVNPQDSDFNAWLADGAKADLKKKLSL